MNGGEGRKAVETLSGGSCTRIARVPFNVERRYPATGTLPWEPAPPTPPGATPGSKAQLFLAQRMGEGHKLQVSVGVARPSPLSWLTVYG